MEKIKLGGKTITFKKHALHKQLKVPIGTSIGFTVMRKIKSGKVGSMVKVPNSTKKSKEFKITPLMKKRAVFGLNISGR